MEMDPAREARIWSRVRGEPEPVSGLTPEALRQLAEQALDDAAAYAALACRMPPKANARLGALCRGSRRHARKLAALYYLKTGQLLCPTSPKKPCLKDVRGLLRTQYLREAESSRRLGGLAEASEGFGAVLSAIATEKESHSRFLLWLLERRLPYL